MVSNTDLGRPTGCEIQSEASEVGVGKRIRAVVGSTEQHGNCSNVGCHITLRCCRVTKPAHAHCTPSKVTTHSEASNRIILRYGNDKRQLWNKL